MIRSNLNALTFLINISMEKCIDFYNLFNCTTFYCNLYTKCIKIKI